MNNSVAGTVIKLGFITEVGLTLLVKAGIRKYNNKLRQDAIEKRSLCYKITWDNDCNTVAHYRKTLSTGQVYEWEEIIYEDPFNLYRLFKI